MLEQVVKVSCRTLGIQNEMRGKKEGMLSGWGKNGARETVDSE